MRSRIADFLEGRAQVTRAWAHVKLRKEPASVVVAVLVAPVVVAPPLFPRFLGCAVVAAAAARLALALVEGAPWGSRAAEAGRRKAATPAATCEGPPAA